MNLAGMRRSKNVRDAGILDAPHGILSQLRAGAKLLKGDFLNGAEKLGIVGKNETYKKFGLTDPTASLPHIKDAAEKRKSEREAHVKSERKRLGLP
jgi:hypothetical protein